MSTIGSPRGRLGRTSRPIGIHEERLLTAWDSGNHYASSPSPAALSASVGSLSILSASTDLVEGLNSDDPGRNGYWTGNAKWIHIYVSGTNASTAQNAGVVLHGFNYDIGKWAKLEIPAGHATAARQDGRSKNLNLQSDGFTPAAVRVGPGGSAVMRTIPLNGVDRIGFVTTGSATIAHFDVRASVSTV